MSSLPKTTEQKDTYAWSIATSAATGLRSLLSSVSSTPLSTSSSHLEDQIADKFRPIVHAFEQARDHLSKEASIRFPTIVAIGEQSAAKSSVLESLSGIPLPRGKDITTRCPIKLRTVVLPKEKWPLINDDSSSFLVGSDIGPFRAEIKTQGSHDKPSINICTANKALVDRYIFETQTKITTTPTEITHEPIFVNVYMEKGFDLTLVDLPGITRNAIKGQPDNIEEQIKALLKSWMEPKESILLNVVPASIDDVVTSECLKLSRQVDPMFERTLVVMTKIDRCEGNVAEKATRMVQDLNIKLGAVLMQTRTQEETNRGVTLQEALKREPDWISKLSLLDDAQCPVYAGTQSLARLLVRMSWQYISTRFEEITQTITNLYEDRKTQLLSCPDPTVYGNDPIQTIKDFLSKIHQSIYTSLHGEHSIYLHRPVSVNQFVHTSQSQPKTNGSVGTLDPWNDPLNLSIIKTREFKGVYESLEKTISNPLSTGFIQTIENLIKTSSPVLPGMHGSSIVEKLVQIEVKKIQAVILKHINTLYHSMQFVFKSIVDRDISLSKELARRIKDIGLSRLHEQFKLVESYIIDLVQQENHVCLVHDDYYNKLVDELRVYVITSQNQKKSQQLPLTFVDIVLKQLPDFSHDRTNQEQQIYCFAYFRLLKVRTCEHFARGWNAKWIPYISSEAFRTDIEKELLKEPTATLQRYLSQDLELVKKRKRLQESVDKLKMTLDVIQASSLQQCE